MERPEAVLFDFDGVLADTANVHVAAWERVFARIGLELPPEACLTAAEIDDRDFLRSILAEKGIEPTRADEAGWLLHKRDEAIAMLTDEPRLYPGVAQVVGALSETVRLGLVTTAWREAVNAVLDAAGLRARFEVIITKEDVTRTKPDPEPYLRSLERMRLEAGSAIALEDSPSGLRAAIAAGLPCIAVGHRRQRGEWSVGARDYIDGFRSPQRVLRALGLEATKP